MFTITVYYVHMYHKAKKNILSVSEHTLIIINALSFHNFFKVQFLFYTYW